MTAKPDPLSLSWGADEFDETEFWLGTTEHERLYWFDFTIHSLQLRAVAEATLLTDKSINVLTEVILSELTTDETMQLIHEAMPELDINAIVDEEIHGWAVHMGWSAQEVYQRSTFLGTESKWQEALERYRAEQVNPSTGWTVCDCV